MGHIYAIFDLAGANNRTSKKRSQSMLEKVTARFCRQTQDNIYNPSQAVNKPPLNKHQVSYNPMVLSPS